MERDSFELFFLFAYRQARGVSRYIVYRIFSSTVQATFTSVTSYIQCVSMILNRWKKSETIMGGHFLPLLKRVVFSEAALPYFSKLSL